MTVQSDYVEYESVRLGTDGASEMDGTRRLLHIPRADVVGLEIVHGSAAERPLVSLILAALLAAHRSSGRSCSSALSWGEAAWTSSS